MVGGGKTMEWSDVGLMSGDFGVLSLAIRRRPIDQSSPLILIPFRLLPVQTERFDDADFRAIGELFGEVSVRLTCSRDQSPPCCRVTVSPRVAASHPHALYFLFRLLRIVPSQSMTRSLQSRSQ